jgi:hypothetical protein
MILILGVCILLRVRLGDEGIGVKTPHQLMAYDKIYKFVMIVYQYN